jgi:hypothetical protein
MHISQVSTDGLKNAAHNFDPVTPLPLADVEPPIVPGEKCNSQHLTAVEDIHTLHPAESPQPQPSSIELTSMVVVDKPLITGVGSVATGKEMPFPAADSWPVSDLFPDRKRGGTIPRWLVLAVVCLVVAASVLGVLLVVVPFMHSAYSSNNTPTQVVRTMPPGMTPGTTLTRGKHTTPTVKPTHKPNMPGATPKSTGQAILLTPTSMYGTPSPTLQPTSQSSGGPGPQPTPTPPPPTPTPLPSETLTVDFANANGTQTNYSYSGTVTITVSGTGQAASTAYSDAFYVYTDSAGNPLNPPKHENCWVMYINGVSTDHFVSTPSYSSAHSYTFTMPAPGGTLNFSVCDGNHSDNMGGFIVTVAQN